MAIGELNIILSSLIHMKCWRVKAGGAGGSTLILSLGQKIYEPNEIIQKYGSSYENAYKGEADLHVWCAWRLDSRISPITSSDDTETNIKKGFELIFGKSIENIPVQYPAYDLSLYFMGEYTLHIFCDHVPGDPSFDGNWDLFIDNGREIHVGPGSQYEIK